MRKPVVGRDYLPFRRDKARARSFAGVLTTLVALAFLAAAAVIVIGLFV
jgi:hypothetical protein